jgi:DNA-binding transcriptional MerR regulator
MSASSPSLVQEFYTGDVQNLTGLSKHMVDYLCRHGLLTASRSPRRGYGNRRRFDFTDVLLARSIKKLLESNVSVLSLREALGELRRQLHSQSSAVLRDQRIVIRNGVPYLAEPDGPLSDLTAGGQMAFSFVLDVEHLQRRAGPVHAQREADRSARIARAQRTRQERIS